MMSKCIKEKGWVVMVSVLTTPLCSLGGLYQGFACRHPLTTQTFLAPPASLFNVLCLVARRFAIVSSALCQPPPPSVSLPSVNICSTEVTPATSSCLWLNNMNNPSASTTLQFSEAGRDCPVTTISSASKLWVHPLCRLLIACTG